MDFLLMRRQRRHLSDDLQVVVDLEIRIGALQQWPMISTGSVWDVERIVIMRVNADIPCSIALLELEQHHGE